MKQLLFILTFFVAATAAVWGQSSAGSLTGTITDVNKAVVPGATVTLADSATNTLLTATTNSEGVYTFAAVRPAIYCLSAAQPGFKATFVEAVEIATAPKSSRKAARSTFCRGKPAAISGKSAAIIATRSNAPGKLGK